MHEDSMPGYYTVWVECPSLDWVGDDEVGILVYLPWVPRIGETLQLEGHELQGEYVVENVVYRSGGDGPEGFYEEWITLVTRPGKNGYWNNWGRES